jgi:hypothetical protein
MSGYEYRKEMEKAQEELERLLMIRTAVDQQITKHKSAVAILGAMLEEPPKITKLESAEEIGDLGISDAIRAVLRDTGLAATPLQIRDFLIAGNFDLSKYANPSAVIHNTLKRLETQGEVVQYASPGGPCYCLRHAVDQAVLESLQAGFEQGMGGGAEIPSPEEAFGKPGYFEEQLAKFPIRGGIK